MKYNEIIEGFTEFYVNDYYGWEVVNCMSDPSLDGYSTVIIWTFHFTSSLHINDEGHIVDMDNRKYQFRNHEQLSLLNDIY